MNDLRDATRPVSSLEFTSACDLLQPIFDNGTLVYQRHHVSDCRQNARTQLARLSPRTRRFLNPQPYVVGLESRLCERKAALLRHVRQEARFD